MLAAHDRENFDKRLLNSVSGTSGSLRAAVIDGLHGGKRFRPMLCRAWFRASAGGESDGWIGPAIAVELVHRASLCHDDLPCMDDAQDRNGRPAVHRVHGPAHAVLAGDALIAAAFRQLCSLAIAQPASLILANAITAMATGQTSELRNPDEMSLRNWMSIADGKTGALLAASCQLGALAAGVDCQATLDEAGLFGTLLGRLYQLRDDLEDGDLLPDEIAEVVDPSIARMRVIAGAMPARSPLDQIVSTVSKHAIAPAHAFATARNA